jgi:glycosyltransferase involved in cell wall biosynthesis
VTAGPCSIVIPCFNQAHFLREAIDSARQQRGVATEVIVVDDGSSDSTSSVALGYADVRLVRQPNRGLSAARNAGLEAAQHPFIIFLDADDVLLPDAAAIGLALLEHCPDAALAAGRCRLIDRRGTVIPTSWAPAVRVDHYRRFLDTNVIWTPGAAVFRRDAVLAAGGFALAYPAAADYRLYLSLARSRGIACHEAEVVLYRQHDANMSYDPVLMLTSTLAALDDERPHVPDGVWHDYRRGRRAWQDYYGDQIANGVRYFIRQPGCARVTLRLLMVLLRYHPLGFARHLTRKLLVTVGLKRDEPPATTRSQRPDGVIPTGSVIGERMAPSPPSR